MNPYEVLGVDKNSDQKTIKSAYKKLAKKYHPDLNKEPGAEDKFKEVNEAYSILSDETKKRNYDTYGSPDGPQGFGGTGAGFDPNDIFGDIFSGFGFNGRGKQQNANSPRQGRNMECNIKLKFEEAVFGCKKTIKFNRQQTCSHCKGTGGEPGTKVDTCDVCKGTGVISKYQQTPFGSMHTQTQCTNCHGTGKIIKNPCKVCKTSGRETKQIEIEVNIPAGIDNGMIIPLKGQGEGGYNGGPAGDILIKVAVEPSKEFTRNGINISSSIEIDTLQALTGTTVKIKTLTGTIEKQLDPGVQYGHKITLPGYGVNRVNSKLKGDHIVEVKINTNKLTPEQIEKIKNL